MSEISDIYPIFNGEVLMPRLIARIKDKNLKHITGYIRMTRNEKDPAYMFTAIYSQTATDAPIGLVNIIIHDKVYTKDLATIETVDISKLYNLAHNEKDSVLYTKAFNADTNVFVESGSKVEEMRQYAEAVYLWLNTIFTK